MSLAQEYRFVSGAVVEYNQWVGTATLHADGTISYDLLGCSRGYQFAYTRRGDSVYIHGALTPGPSRPDPASVLVERGGDLYSQVELPDTVEFRYAHAEPLTLAC